MSAPRLLRAEELPALAGEELGVSPWLRVDQERIDAFAAATGDDNWFHVDRARAAAGPYGRTIAHGYLTLSLWPMLMWQVLKVESAGPALNYGLDRVRFPAPVPEGAEIRLRVRLAAAEAAPTHVQTTWEHTIEVRGADKPACVARVLTRYVLEPGGAA